jgi:arabinosaccharide transport system substrate-binding protein
MTAMNRRTFLKQAAVTGALALGGSTFVSACEGPFVNTGAKKTLNFWAFADTRLIWQKKAWELYKQQKHPDFEISWLVLPYQQMHDQVLITAQAGSGGPDIADIEISQFSRYIKGDVIFVDLMPKLAQMGGLDNFYHPSATDPWSWQNKIYGIGNELNTCLMSYRWDVWQKARVKTPITSWDEFAQEAVRFHHDTGHYLIDFPFNDWGSWWMMTLQQKGGFFAPDGQPTLTSPQAINTLSYHKKAINDGWAIVRALGPAYNALLSSGTVASLLGPSWQFSGFTQQNLPDTKGKWHLQPLPVWTPGGSRTATWGGTGVSVLKTSSSVDEAIDFVLFEHTNPQALLADFDARQVWPTYKPALQDSRLSEPLAFFDNQRVGDMIKEVSPEINKWYNSPFWSETTDACIRLGITPVLQQGASPESAMNNAQSQAKSIINFETA